MGKSMHENVDVWCDTCSCEPEPRWQAIEADDAADPPQRRTLGVHCLEHVSFEGPGQIATWAALRGHAVTATHVYREPVPALGEVFDLNPNTMTEPPGLLVLMGGPMSVNDTAEHAWIEPETQRVREAIDAGAAVLGVCLGAQLIARALGAAVYPMNHREIGWHPVEAVNNHQAFGLPRRFTPLHWHGETFDLPDGATRLAGNEACANQAFAVGRRVVGLQFHLETTSATAAALVEHCGHEISPGPDQQTPQQIADCDAQAAAVHPILFALLDRITVTP